MTREGKLKRGSVGSVGSVGSTQLLSAIRDLYSRLPETYLLEPWELVHVLYSLNYTDDLADEAEITAAIEVAGGTGRNVARSSRSTVERTKPWPRRGSDSSHRIILHKRRRS